MSRFWDYAIAILGGTVVFFVLLFAWARYNRKRLARKFPIGPSDREKLEGRLLDYIKAQTGDRREPIRLGPFWKQQVKAMPVGLEDRRRVPFIIRDEVIRDLINKRHVRLPDDQAPPGPPKPPQGLLEDFLAAIGEMFREIGSGVWEVLNDGWAAPASAVRLTDSTFDRMTHGASGHTIIGGNVQHNHGTFFNSPPTMAGRDAQVSVTGGPINIAGSPFDPSTLDAIIDVLRKEAVKAQEPFRTQMQEVASGVEKEVGAGVVDQEAVVSRMQRANRIIAAAGGVFSASNEAVKAWFQLKNQL